MMIVLTMVMVGGGTIEAFTSLSKCGYVWSDLLIPALPCPVHAIS